MALSRERAETTLHLADAALSAESDIPGGQSLGEESGGLLEPLLSSGAAGAGEPELPGRGRTRTAPGFSVGNVSLEVRRGEVRHAWVEGCPRVGCKILLGCVW